MPRNYTMTWILWEFLSSKNWGNIFNSRLDVQGTTLEEKRRKILTKQQLKPLNKLLNLQKLTAKNP